MPCADALDLVASLLCQGMDVSARDTVRSWLVEAPPAVEGGTAAERYARQVAGGRSRVEVVQG